MEQTFFEEMAHQIYTYNYKIDGQNVFHYISFIEEKHKRVPVKGFYFYTNLMLAMADYCGAFADIKKGEIPSYKEKVFNKVLEYCKKKMVGLEGSQTLDEGQCTRESLSVKQIVLKHYYLSKHRGQLITKNNMKKLAERYGKKTSGISLYNGFIKVFNSNGVSLSITNKKSARCTLDDLEVILPLLKTENSEAHLEAEGNYIEFKKKYSNFYGEDYESR